jgi:hypothetical protein
MFSKRKIFLIRHGKNNILACIKAISSIYNYNNKNELKMCNIIMRGKKFNINNLK